MQAKRDEEENAENAGLPSHAWRMVHEGHSAIAVNWDFYLDARLRKIEGIMCLPTEVANRCPTSDSPAMVMEGAAKRGMPCICGTLYAR